MAATVVVPAHNEAPIIVRCLDRLSELADLELVVVTNGSTDATAELVRAWRSPAGEPATLLDLPEPSKTAAIRAGLAAARPGLPVLVCDADVQVAPDAMRAVVAALGTDRPVIAAPMVALDAGRSSRVVRRWVDVWTSLPYVRSGVVGSGLMAMSSAGARRVEALPDVLNDDGWIRRQFPAGERVAVAAAFSAAAPLTTWALVRRRARVLLGNAELVAILGPDPERTQPAGLRDLVRQGRVSLIDVAAYAGVAVAAKLLAAYRIGRGRRRLWAADQTTRQQPVAA